MQIETLFSSTRWEILNSLSKKESSPMELADELNTTSANISQQLRLLELAGLVKSEKTSNVDKGKPRVVYSLDGDQAYLILSQPGFSDKKLVKMSMGRQFLLKSFFLSESNQEKLIELYYAIKDNLDEIEFLGVEEGASLQVYVILKKNFKLPAINITKVRVNEVTLAEAVQNENIVSIYDPKRSFWGGRQK